MVTVERSREKASARLSPEILDRQPPRSLEAERAVLGSILLLPEVCDDVALIVRPSDFYDEANSTLFAEMLVLHDSGKKIDVTLLVENLRKSGNYDLIGGASFVADLIQSVPTAAHATHYAQIIRDKSTLRGLIHASTDILRSAYDESAEPRDTLNRAEECIFAILEKQGLGELTTIQDVLQEAMVRLDTRIKHGHALGGIATGFPDLDAMTGGLHESELSILAARPSVGKTSLALNIAENAAVRDAVPTLIVSLEMSSLELADRLLCSRARVNGSRVRNGTITVEDRRKLVAQAAEISQAPLFIDDSPSRNMTEIAALARRLKRKHQLGLVVIDYLQLIEPDNAKDFRQEQVAKVARRLKGMARELSVPVLCLAQLNRQADNESPRLSHLRESGAIEQDADVVMFLHRDDPYETANEKPHHDVPDELRLIVAKQRNGNTGDIALLWKREYTRFESKDFRHHEEFEHFNSSDSGADF